MTSTGSATNEPAVAELNGAAPAANEEAPIVPDRPLLPRSLSDDDWQDLADAIRGQRCIPVLGAAAYDRYQIYQKIAGEWAHQYEYPFEDSQDLARVAQFLAIKRHSLFPHDQLKQRLADVPPPPFAALDEVHGFLASLPLPLYITTNYDDFLMQALRRDPFREPHAEYCRWSPTLRQFDAWVKDDFEWGVPRPLVYHIHGSALLADSMVLSEDNYLEFLVNTARDEPLDGVRTRVLQDINQSALLFLGYRLTDWDFRVLLNYLSSRFAGSRRGPHVAVQLSPVAVGSPRERTERALAYLDRYFGKREVRVFCGTCSEFVQQLRGKLR